MYESIRDFLSLARSLKTAAKHLMTSDDVIYILSHIDADGITCASILAQLLYLIGKPFVLKFVNRLNMEFLKKFDSEIEPREVMFCDLGSGQLDLISNYLSKARRVFILDHHVPIHNYSKIHDEAPFKVIHVNPRFYGYNGGSEISSSSLSYLLSRVFAGKIKDVINFTKYAVIGALGDNQDVGEKRSLIGLNSLIVNEAKQNEIIEEKIDLLILGRKSKPLYQALAETYNPILPGITGSLEGALKFINNIGLGAGRLDMDSITLDDLNEKQKAILLEKLIERVSLSFGGKISVEEIKNMLIGYVYLLKNEDKPMLADAREFSTLLNACGKLGQPQVGVALIISEKDKFYDQSISLYKRYKYSISEGIKKSRESLKDHGRIKVIDGESWLDENLTSTVASIMSQNLLNGDILVVFSQKINNHVKISLRKLRGSGINNLRELLIRVLDELKCGEGGGHEDAAGAYIPVEKKDEFIKLLKKIMPMVV